MVGPEECPVRPCAKFYGHDGEHMPRRVQRSRHAGARKPENTIIVTRPSKWGNPYPVEVWGRVAAVGMFRLYAIQVLGTERIREELRGKNLACWCAPGAPCHADVLLEIANSEEER